MEKYTDFEHFLEDNYEWNEDSLSYAQNLSNLGQTEEVHKIIKEFGSCISYRFYNYRELFDLLKEYDEKISYIIASENDFVLSDSEIDKVISDNDFHEYSVSNTCIKQKLEEKYIDDEKLFLSKYGDLSGQEAIYVIARVAKPLGLKIYKFHEDIILKRFGCSGIDESSKIKDIISLGVLDEKNLKRAIKRMLKNNQSLLPIVEIYNYNILNNNEIIDLAKDKGYSNVFQENDLPVFLIDHIITSTEGEDYYLLYGFSKKFYNKEQRLKVIKKLGFEYLGDVFKYLKVDEYKHFYDLVSKDKDKYRFNSDQLLQIYLQDEILGLELINISIDIRKDNLYYIIDYDFISGDQIFRIFKTNPERFSQDIASSEVKMKKLKESNCDKEFAEIALKSVKKRDIKKLSQFLLDYIPEEERLSIDLESIKSVDGAVSYILNKGNIEKVRTKAISKIASSEQAIESICAKDENLLSQEEYEKIFSYKKGKEIIFSNNRILNHFLKNISQECLHNNFNIKSIFNWSEENLNKIDDETIFNVSLEYFKDNNLSYGQRKIINYNNINIIKAISLAMKENDHLKSEILESGDSLVSKYFLKEYGSKIEKKYLFIFDEELTNENESFKYFSQYLHSVDDTYSVHLESKINSFINKWDSKKENVISALIEVYSFKKLLSFVLDLNESRNLFFKEFLEKIKIEPNVFIKKTNLYNIEKLEENELEMIIDIIKDNNHALELALGDYSWQKLIVENTSIDKIIPKLISGELKPDSVPKVITNTLISQAVRQRDNFLLRLCYQNSSLNDFNLLINSKEEAFALYEIISNKEKNNYRYSYRSTVSYNDYELESFFKLFKRFDFSEEVSLYLINVAANTSNQQQKTSELLDVFGDQLKEDYLDQLLERTERTGIKAELKRIVNWCISNGYDNYVSARMISDPELYGDIVSKRTIKDSLNEESLSKLLKENPTHSILILIFSKEDLSDEIRAVAFNKIIEMDMVSLKYEDGIFEGFLKTGYYSNSKRLFIYNHVENKIIYNAISKNSENDIVIFLSSYIEITNIQGKLNFKEKTIKQKNGKTFDLKEKEIGFITENPQHLNQISGLYNFGVEIELEAKIVLDRNAKAQCFIYNTDMFNKKNTKSDSVRKIEKNILREQSEIEADFDEIMGKMSNEFPFGVEMEFGSNMKRETLAKKINERVEDLNIQGTDRYTSLNYNDWEIKYDSSIEGKFSAEIVSPKLYGEEGLNELYNVIEAVSNINTKGQIKTGIGYNCGIHVHHEIKDILSAQENMDEITTALYSIQEPLYALCDKSRSTNSYCSKIYYSDKKIINDFRGGFNTSTGYGTLEFRMKEGSMNSQEILNWVKVTKKIVDDTRDMFKRGVLSQKDKIKEGYNDLLNAIILEKSRQIKMQTSENNHLEEDSYESFIFNDILLGK